MHIWQKETAKERNTAEAYIDKLNTELEPILKEE